MATSHHHAAGDIGPGASRGPVTRVIACKVFTLGTSGAVAWVVPWVRLRKAAVLAGAMPGRGAGQSHFLTALVMRPAGRKEDELLGAGDGGKSSPPASTPAPVLPPSGTQKGHLRATTQYLTTPARGPDPGQHSQPLRIPWSRAVWQASTHTAGSQVPPGLQPTHPPRALDNRSQHPMTAGHPYVLQPASPAVRANSLPGSFDPQAPRCQDSRLGEPPSQQSNISPLPQAPQRARTSLTAPLPLPEQGTPPCRKRANEATSLSQRSPARQRRELMSFLHTGINFSANPGRGRAGSTRPPPAACQLLRAGSELRRGGVGLMAAGAKTHSPPPRKAGKCKTKSLSCSSRSRSGAQGHRCLCKWEIPKTYQALHREVHCSWEVEQQRAAGLVPHVEVQQHARKARAEPVTQLNAVSTTFAQPSFEAAPPEPGLAKPALATRQEPISSS